jgi:hypothetical protein
MPDYLLTYSIENSLIIISINSQIWGGVMVIRLVIDFGELVKVPLKKGEGWEKEWVGGLRGMGAVGLCALMCVWVYFCCCSGGCLCQRF